MIGGCLVYATLSRRWGYYAGPPPNLNALSSEDRAALTVYWWSSNNNCCGPFPAIWPALAILSALPLLVAAFRQRHPPRFWGTVSLLSILFGLATMLIAVTAFLERGWMSDSNWVYKPDLGTIAIALSGYGLLLLSVLLLMKATGSPRISTAPTAPDRV